MMTTFAGFRVVTPKGWEDITADLPDGSPLTLAKADGLGALQFSTARYSSGTDPDLDRAALAELLGGFGAAHGLGSAINVGSGGAECFFVFGDFHREGELIRAWYVSNGSDVVLATYVVQAQVDARVLAELSEAQAIVESVRL